MLRTALVMLLAGAALTARAQGGGLVGHVDGDSYVSPTGAFRLRVPVLPELGGQISDTENVVTFRDDFGTLISIAAFPQNAGERWKLQTRGTKDYLLGFFTDYVLPDFKRSFPRLTVDKDAVFMPTLMDGALLVYMELPGGSMFASQVVTIDPDRKIRPAKRGNLLFVHDGFIFVISSELSERVLEGTAYTLTPDQENLTLRERLEDIVAQIHFLKPAQP